MIVLKPFDEQFLKSLEGHKNILISKEGFYHAVIYNGEKVGVVGYVPAKFSDKAGFVQTVIAPDFREKGLSGKAKDILAKKYNLKELYATIKKDNIPAIKACQKNGFRELDSEEQDRLRAEGFLKKEEIRLVKKYK